MNAQLKELFVLSNLSIGGVQSFSIELALHFAQEDLKVTIIDQGNTKPGDSEYIGDQEVSILKEKVKIISKQTFFKSWNILGESSLLIVTMTASKFLENCRKSIAKHSVGPTIFGYLHGMGAYYYDSFKVYQPLLHGLISVSEMGKRKLIRLFPERKNTIHFLQCPTSIGLGSKQEKKHLSDGYLNIMFIGRMYDKVKGIFTLPIIAKALGENQIPVRFRMVGSGPDLKELKSLMTEVKHPKMEFEYVENAKTPAQVEKYYIASDVLLCLSNYEGAPLVIKEAMACGVVPLSYNVGDIAKMFEDNHSGYLFGKKDYKDMIASLLKLFGSPDQLKRMSLAARSEHERNGRSFTWYAKKIRAIHSESAAYDCENVILSIKRNKREKAKNILKWVKDIIPGEVMHKNHFGHYFRHFKTILEKKQKTINTLQQKLREYEDS